MTSACPVVPLQTSLYVGFSFVPPAKPLATGTPSFPAAVASGVGHGLYTTSKTSRGRKAAALARSA